MQVYTVADIGVKCVSLKRNQLYLRNVSRLIIAWYPSEAKM